MSSHTQDKHQHHGGTPLIYTANLVALLILTAITVGAAYIDLGPGNIVMALAIASVKATLVALFFMQLFWDKKVNAIIAVAGFLFLGIFLMFTLLDFDSRNNYLPANIRPVPGMPLAPGTAPKGEVLHDNPAAAPEGGEKK